MSDTKNDNNLNEKQKTESDNKLTKEIKTNKKLNKKEKLKNILIKSVDILTATSVFNILMIFTVAIFSFIIYISQNPTIPIILIVVSYITYNIPLSISVVKNKIPMTSQIISQMITTLFIVIPFILSYITIRLIPDTTNKGITSHLNENNTIYSLFKDLISTEFLILTAVIFTLIILPMILNKIIISVSKEVNSKYE